MKKFRNFAAIALTVALVAGMNGCSEPSVNANSEISPVGQVREPIPAADDALTLSSDSPIAADASAKLANAKVNVMTQAAPKPDPVPEPVVADPIAKKNAVSASPVPAQKNAAPAPVAKAPVAVPTTSGQAWIQATMAKYGVYPVAGTKFAIGPMPAGCIGADGCTEYMETAEGVISDYVITLRPGQLTEYLLFHEIGHARGIRDECGADNFARSVLGPVPGHYC